MNREYYKNLNLENIDGELWKEIKGFENRYLVSNFGRIKSLVGKGVLVTQIRKQSLDTSKYPQISLRNRWGSKNEISKSYSIHRFVAETFIPNINNLPQVNHKNGIKTDNRVENLEWITKSENQRHAYKIGLKRKLIGEQNHVSVLKNEQAKEIRLLYKTLHYSFVKLGKIYNVSETTVSRIVNNKTYINV